MSRQTNILPDNPQIEVIKSGKTGLFTNYIYKAIPLAFDESMSYYETLLGLLNYLKNVIIPSVNNNADAVSELQTLYKELNNYVKDYFNNLDVQEEINNKLDQLVEDETIQNILNNLLLDYVIPESFGAKGDGITDDYNALLDCINYANANNKNIKLIKTYLINKPNSIGKNDYLFILNTSIFGNGTLLMGSNVGEYKSIFRVSHVNNLTFKDFTINQNSANNIIEDLTDYGYKSCFSFGDGQNLTINNVKFLNTYGTWVIEGGGVNYATITNCKNLNAGINQTLSYDTSNFYFLGDYINITNNLFEGKSLAVRTAIEVESNYKNVSDNIINGFPTGIIVASTSTENNAGKVNINNNIIHECQYGIILWATNKDLKNIKLTNNQIYPITQQHDTILNQVIGIYFYYPSQYNFENIQISNNLIEYLDINPNANEHSNAIDISVYYNDITHYIKNITINNNTIKNSIGSGICVNTRGVEDTILIQENIIENWHNGDSVNNPFNNAITIGTDPYTVKNIKINNNIFKNNNPITNYALLISSRNIINNEIDINNNFFDTTSHLINITANVGKIKHHNKATSFDLTSPNADFNSIIEVGTISYLYNGSNWIKVTTTTDTPTQAGNDGDIAYNLLQRRGDPQFFKYIIDTWYPVLQQGYRRQTLSGFPTFNCNFLGELVYNTYDKTWYIGIDIGQSGENGWKLITT